jgi:microcystin-dependent protein
MGDRTRPQRTLDRLRRRARIFLDSSCVSCTAWPTAFVVELQFTAPMVAFGCVPLNAPFRFYSWSVLRIFCFFFFFFTDCHDAMIACIRCKLLPESGSSLSAAVSLSLYAGPSGFEFDTPVYVQDMDLVSILQLLQANTEAQAAQLQSIQGTVDAQARKIDTLGARLEDAQAENTQLKEIIKQMQKNANQTSEAGRAADSTMNPLQFASLISNVTALRALDSLELQHLSSLQSDFIRLDSISSFQSDSLRTQQSQLLTLNQTNAESFVGIRNSVSALQSQLATANADVSVVQAQFASLSADAASQSNSLSSQTAELNRSIATLSSQLNTTNYNIGAVQAQQNSTAIYVATLEAHDMGTAVTMATHTAALATLATNVAALQVANDTNTVQLNSQANSIEAVNTFLSGQAKQIADLQAANATNTMQLNVQAGAIYSLNATLSVQIAQLADLATPLSPGTIVATTSSSIPIGWLLCNGALVSRSIYAALFAAIGTLYGVGDGSTTFNLPDLRGRDIIGTGTGVGLSPRALGAKGGEETHTLSVVEMPSHNHLVNTINNPANYPPENNYNYVRIWQGGNAGGLCRDRNSVPLSRCIMRLIYISNCTWYLVRTWAAPRFMRDKTSTRPLVRECLVSLARWPCLARERSLPATQAAKNEHLTCAPLELTLSPLLFPSLVEFCGGSAGHNNMQPFFVATWIIRT